MRRTARFVVLVSAGLLVFFVGGYWAGISSEIRTAVKVANPVLFLAAALWCRRNESLRPWRNAFIGFFAASCGFLAAWWLSGPLARLVGATADSVSGIALLKFADALPIILTVIAVARAGGMSFTDLGLGKGKPKIWLPVGLATFAAFAVVFGLQVMELGIDGPTLAAYVPWTLLFVGANALMEEVHFRGLLLGPFEELVGRHPANLCIALVFTLVHAPVQYAPDILVFLAIVFVLAIAWGYLIQRSGSVWGSVLFHAGADLLIVVGIYSTYGIE